VSDFFRFCAIFELARPVKPKEQGNLKVAPEMKKVFLFLILSLLSILAYAQDYIVLKSGKQIIAKVFDVSSTEVQYKPFQLLKEPERIVPLADVFAINYENEKTLPYNLLRWVAAYYPKYFYREIKFFEDPEFKRYVYRIKLQRKGDIYGATVWFTLYGDFLQEEKALPAEDEEKILYARETNKMQTSSIKSETQMDEFKRCPYCGEEILAVAIKCKHCGEWLDKTATSRTSRKQPTAKNSQNVTLKNPFKGVALGINGLTGFAFKNNYMDVGFGVRLSYTFSVPIRLAGEFDILWGIPNYEAWFLTHRWMDYGVSLQYLFSGKGKRFAVYPLVGIGGINQKVKVNFLGEEVEHSQNRFALTLGYGVEGLSKNGKFFYGVGMRFKIVKLNLGPYKYGSRVHTIVGIGYKF